MKAFQQSFIEFALSKQVLKFGEFELKSGRISPYFFNAGLFNTGADMATLSYSYAHAIVDSDMEFDVLFGPAYKGIPLASTTALTLADKFNRETPFCFNRKEAKTHGEGGNLVGAPLKGKVLIIDDVITAGTAIREAIDIIQAAGAEPAGVVIALDRQERGKGELSAIQEVEKEYGIPVVSIIKMEHLLTFLQKNESDTAIFERVHDYKEQYGIDE